MRGMGTEVYSCGEVSERMGGAKNIGASSCRVWGGGANKPLINSLNTLNTLKNSNPKELARKLNLDYTRGIMSYSFA